MNDLYLTRLVALACGLGLINLSYKHVLLPVLRSIYKKSFESLTLKLDKIEREELPVQKDSISFVRDLTKGILVHLDDISISSYLHFRATHTDLKEDEVQAKAFSLFHNQCSSEVKIVYSDVAKLLSRWMAIKSPGWAITGMIVFLASLLLRFAIEKWFKREALEYVEHSFINRSNCHV